MAKKELIVDDEPNLVTALEFLMQQAEYQVEVARTGNEALDKVQQLVPDLVLLDIMLPDLNGYEVLQQVRRNPAWATMAIIMLSAKGRDVEVAKGLALGANAYLTKPFSIHDLLAAVRRCLEEV